MPKIIGPQWHSLPNETVYELLGANKESGLTPEEEQKRIIHYGPNIIKKKKKNPPLVRFILQFHNPLLYVLLIASLVTAFLREWVDSGVIFAVVFINAIIGYIQESKAEKAMEALEKMVITKALILPNDERKQVLSCDLVPWDIVLLSSGDKVPADMRITTVQDLHVDESSLTGESFPVAKVSIPLPQDTHLADRKNMAYFGTLVTYGRAGGVVTGTGFRPDGEFLLEGKAVNLSDHPNLKKILYAGVLCNDSRLVEEYNLSFLGLAAMLDPPRSEVMKAISMCHRAGIKVKMITGDHPATALAIEGQIGISNIGDQTDFLTGQALEKFSNDHLPGKVLSSAGFARVSPEQKLRIVNSLQKNNQNRSIIKIGIFSKRAFWIGILIMVTAQLGFTYFPLMNTLFRSLPMKFIDWVQVLLITFPVYFIVELEKWIWREKPLSRKAQ